jgi:ribosome-associated protein YbcJ (S4-like RNA binding protein)
VKLGTENRKKVALAAGLLLLAVFVLVRNFTSSSTASSPSSAPVVSAPIVLPGKGATEILPDTGMDPRLRLDLLPASADVEYKGIGRNIFRAGPETVKSLPQAVASPLPKAATPPPPPTINLKFFGFATRQGGASKVFLAQGDDVFVAGEGDIVNRRYKILRITPNAVDVEDVISNIRQTLPLTQG